MAGSAKVESIDSLKALRRTLFKFAEAANVALSDAESELTRTLMWVENEQTQYWTSQIRKRADMVSRCAEAVRMKQLFTDAAGRRPSAIDEIKALEKAKRALEVAQQKLANCKRWQRLLEKEVQNYRGTVQRFATTVQADLPVVAARLHNAIVQLERYVSLGMPIEQTSTAIEAGASAAADSGEETTSMKRAPADEPEEAEQQPDQQKSSEPGA
jgi:hypothetical protein